MSNLLANYRLSSSIPAPVDVNARKPRHATSSLADLCRLLQIPSARAEANTSLSFKHVQLTAKQAIYSVGQPFDALYVVNSGFVKTTLPDGIGHEQVLGFPMKGELLGTDGIHQKKYASNAVALSHCNLVRVPFEVLRSLNKEYPEIELAMYRIMSQKLMQDRSQLNIMGSRISEVRVAHFLTYMSERFSSLGYSDKEFKLHMTRQEIASYLGLSLETVSRTFSAFHQLDLIAVSGRSITIRQAQKLKTLRRLPQLREKTKERLLHKDRMNFNALAQLSI